MDQPIPTHTLPLTAKRPFHGGEGYEEVGILLPLQGGGQERDGGFPEQYCDIL